MGELELDLLETGWGHSIGNRQKGHSIEVCVHVSHYHYASQSIALSD